ncbi:MAG: hypothetical protein V1921_01950 [Candidatus Altiarchaeota archaeon]
MEKDKAYVIVLYALLTAVLTYPLIQNITDSIFGNYDSYYFLWDLWWFKHSITELKGNPFYASHQFYPTGVSLSLSTISHYNAMVGFMLQNFFTLVVTYNLLILSTFILAGYGTYLLALKLTADKRASFVAGLIYAFSPYHVSETLAGHLNLTSIQWIPFYVLYLLKAGESRKRSDAIMASIFFVLNALCSWQYMGFMLMFTLIYLVNQLNRRTLKVVGQIMVISALLVAPFFYPTLAAIFSSEYEKPQPLSAAYYSMDLISFFTPNMFHPLLNGISRAFYRLSKSIYLLPPAIPLGYTIMFLMAYHLRASGACARIKNEAASTYRRYFPNISFIYVGGLVILSYLLIFGASVLYAIASLLVLLLTIITFVALLDRQASLWTKTFLVFLILSFGPILHVFGTLTIPMPYMFFMLIPGFSIFRAPTRFTVMLMLSGAIISALGLKKMLNRSSRKNLLTLAVSVLILFEFMSALPVTKLHASPAYDDIKNGPEDFAVLEVPIAPRIIERDNSKIGHGIPQYLYYQTLHQRPIVGGYVSYPSRTALGFMQDSLVFGPLNDPDHKNFTGEWVEAFLPALREYNLRYVVVHHDVLLTDLYENGTDEKVSRILSEAFNGQKPLYSDSEVTAYRVY